MIDTIKIFTQINKKTYDIIKYKSDVRLKYNEKKDKLYYTITTDNLKGSFDSSISVRVEENFYNIRGYILIVECSYHKVQLGHNAFNGFYNLAEIVYSLKKLLENEYKVTLPAIKNWFLKRIDITKTYDLDTQKNVKNYINSLNLLEYPRRKKDFYNNRGIYFSGQITTFKIYNKYLEFMKNDYKRLCKFSDVDIDTLLNKIRTLIRFECEIKFKKLKDIYKRDYIRVDSIRYNDLEKIWVDEMSKILKFDYKMLNKIVKKDDVCSRLYTVYKSTKASVLYAFYLQIITDGYNKVRQYTTKSTFYRKISDLKNAGVDLSDSQSVLYLTQENYVFNPMTNKDKEVM